MNDGDVRDALGRVGGDDAAARERAWRVIRAAYAGCEVRPRRRRWTPLVVAAALVPVAAVGAAAASAPDSGVGRWVRNVLGARVHHAQPVLGRLPGGGRLLVQAAGSAWVVSADGAKRRVGAYAATTWSPRGLFIAGWRGRELTALDPGGSVRWSLATPAPVSVARWAPVDGFRVAYLSGGELRVVNGDGTGDHRYAAGAPGVAPAWRPDAGHVLAYLDAQNRVSVDAVDSARRLWRTAPLSGVLQLAWSAGADRLLVVTRHRLVLLDGSGRRLASGAVRPGFLVTDVEWAPRGDALALVRLDPAAGRSELVLVDTAHALRERLLFTGPGSFQAPAWSPDSARLLVPWPQADQWLFLRPGPGAGLIAVANIAAQFGPGAVRPSFPRSAQWCCAPSG